MNPFVLAILKGAAATVPGASDIQKGLDALIHRNEDPSDDFDEVYDAVALILVGAVVASEGLARQDWVNDPVLKELLVNVKRDVALVKTLLVRQS